MQLIYLYIENYKNIQNQGFNFTTQFKCDYKDGTLTIDKNENYIENFFGDNIEVSAIVGENGSGKSSVFEILINILSTNDTLQYLYVLSDGLENICYANNIKVIADIQVEMNLSLHKKNGELKSSLNSNVNLQKYFDVYYLNISHLERDGVIKNDAPSPDDPINYLGIYKKNDIYKDSANDLDASYSEFNYDRFHFFHTRALAELLRNEKYKKLFFTTFGINIPYSIKVDYNQREIERIKVENTLKDSDDNRAISIDEPKNIQALEDFLEQNQNILTINSLEFEEFFKLAGKIYNSLGLFRLTFLAKDGTKIKFSAGEKTILFYLQRIDLMLDKIERDKKNSILLFDEIELYLHPSWQKRVLKIILDFIAQTPLANNLQILLATHSPFILSDIPRQNIVFLKDGKQVDALEKKQTFGANIHTLLADGFFMDGGLMGEFAKEKIEDVIKFLNNDKSKIKDKKEVLNLIDIIGEPFLKQKLQDMYFKKFNDNSIDEQIKKLERQIERLKNVKS